MPGMMNVCKVMTGLCAVAAALTACNHGNFHVPDKSHAVCVADTGHGVLELPQGKAVHARFKCENPPMLRQGASDFPFFMMQDDVLHFSHSEFVRLLGWIKQGEMLNVDHSRVPSATSYYTLQFTDRENRVVLELDPLQDIGTAFESPGSRARMRLNPQDLEQLKLLPVYREYQRHEKHFHR